MEKIGKSKELWAKDEGRGKMDERMMVLGHPSS